MWIKTWFYDYGYVPVVEWRPVVPAFPVPELVPSCWPVGVERPVYKGTITWSSTDGNCHTSGQKVLNDG